MLAPPDWGTPKNQVPGISSLKGELGIDAPMLMAKRATNPNRAGRNTRPRGSARSSGLPPWPAGEANRSRMRDISTKRSSPVVRVVLADPTTGSAMRVEARSCGSFSTSGLSGWNSDDMGVNLLTRMISPAPDTVYQSGDPSAPLRATVHEPPTQPLRYTGALWFRNAIVTMTAPLATASPGRGQVPWTEAVSPSLPGATGPGHRAVSFSAPPLSRQRGSGLRVRPSPGPTGRLHGSPPTWFRPGRPCAIGNRARIGIGVGPPTARAIRPPSTRRGSPRP